MEGEDATEKFHRAEFIKALRSNAATGMMSVLQARNQIRLIFYASTRGRNFDSYTPSYNLSYTESIGSDRGWNNFPLVLILQ